MYLPGQECVIVLLLVYGRRLAPKLLVFCGERLLSSSTRGLAGFSPPDQEPPLGCLLVLLDVGSANCLLDVRFKGEFSIVRLFCMLGSFFLEHSQSRFDSNFNYYFVLNS